jgi:hypothetical protein
MSETEDRALALVPGIIGKMISGLKGKGHEGSGDAYVFLRSMMIQLGEIGRLLTYDQDHAAASLRTTLLGMGQIAYEWADQISNSLPGVHLTVRYAIGNEAVRAHIKHAGHSLLGDESTELQRFAALAEECGEAADMVNPNMRVNELIQVASVCVSWIARMDVQDAIPADQPIADTEIHGSCTHCPDYSENRPAEAILRDLCAEALNAAVASAGFRDGRYEIKVSGLKVPSSGLRFDYKWQLFPPVKADATPAGAQQAAEAPAQAGHPQPGGQGSTTPQRTVGGSASFEMPVVPAAPLRVGDNMSYVTASETPKPFTVNPELFVGKDWRRAAHRKPDSYTIMIGPGGSGGTGGTGGGRMRRILPFYGPEISRAELASAVRKAIDLAGDMATPVVQLGGELLDMIDDYCGAEADRGALMMEKVIRRELKKLRDQFRRD